MSLTWTGVSISVKLSAILKATIDTDFTVVMYDPYNEETMVNSYYNF